MLFKRLTTVGNGFEIFTSGNSSVRIRFAGSQTAVRLALGGSNPSGRRTHIGHPRRVERNNESNQGGWAVGTA